MSWHEARKRDFVKLVAKDSHSGSGKPAGALSDEVVGEIAGGLYEMLRAQLGRAPTVEEVQRAMVELAAVVYGRLYAEEAVLISGTSSNVEAPNGDADPARGVRVPADRRGRHR